MSKKLIHIIIAILIVGTLSLSIYAVTYAWFVISKDSNTISNTAKGGDLDIIYTKGQNITGTLSPSDDNSESPYTTVKIRKTSTSVDGLATIVLNITEISTELAISALKWEVYKDTSTTPIRSGTFAGVTSGNKINLIENYLLTNTDTTFTVKLWLNGNEASGNTGNKTFSAYIDASAINVPSNMN